MKVAKIILNKQSVSHWSMFHTELILHTKASFAKTNEDQIARNCNFIQFFYKRQTLYF